MAYSSHEIVYTLPPVIEARLEHLLKLYYFRGFKHYTYWWTINVYKCNYLTFKDRRTNKWPTRDFLFSHLWEDEKDAFQELHNGYIEKFSTFKDLPKIEKPDVKGSAAFCEHYFEWLSQKLSEKGWVFLPEVATELERLLGVTLTAHPSWGRYAILGLPSDFM